VSAQDRRDEQFDRMLDEDDELDAWAERLSFAEGGSIGTIPDGVYYIFQRRVLECGAPDVLCALKSAQPASVCAPMALAAAAGWFLALLRLRPRLSERTLWSLALAAKRADADRHARAGLDHARGTVIPERSPPHLVLLTNAISRTGPPVASLDVRAGIARRPAIHSTAATA
jgi:hypothetical protein